MVSTKGDRCHSEVKPTNGSCGTTSNSRMRSYLSSDARSSGTGLCRMADRFESTEMREERHFESYGTYGGREKSPGELKVCDEGCI